MKARFEKMDCPTMVIWDFSGFRSFQIFICGLILFRPNGLVTPMVRKASGKAAFAMVT